MIQSEKRTILLHDHYPNTFHETGHGDLPCYGAGIGEEVVVLSTRPGHDPHTNLLRCAKVSTHADGER
jgi:hypothetical protein